ncbi:unnamed protein product [Acanthoscelides obtectus]|uniref:Swiss Army Knife protein DSP-PTPase phosphatase domain-containing protein n=1 Tax=Acanthoscelides obtectus TaxID=200917 RepID=A0A9P0MI88_ACAOB|nr:unnamed protein product [Acanthoscelides obtectus]CAK1626238.1 Dual specificity protein phosphatase 23 [Acanthoscelides obtectus]
MLCTGSELEYSTPPYNFSWMVEGCLAGMACPSNTSEIRYLVENGIGHLVTLSEDRTPPMDDDSIRNHIKWTVIPVVEFEPPTLDDMKKFIAICKEHQEKVRDSNTEFRLSPERSDQVVAFLTKCPN